MRIAIDARFMGAERSRGIGRYIEEMVRGILPLVEAQGDTIVLIVRDQKACLFPESRTLTYVYADIPWYSFREQFVMPFVFARTRADVIHVPHWNVPLLFLNRATLIVTIHDILLHHQSARESVKASTRNILYLWMKRCGYQLTLWMALRRARLVTVPTAFVKQDLQAHYPWCRDVRVTGEGLSSLPMANERLLPAPYLLYVGSAYPHKRVDSLLNVWKTLSQKRSEHHLVITGEKDVFLKRLQERVEREQLPRVHFPGRLTDQELATYYHHAELFVFPSAHEGFGLPPLEALSQGCPAVISDIGCHREVVNVPGILFFRTDDENDMMQKIGYALDHLPQLRREALDGAVHIRETHRWSEMAAQTFQYYQLFRPAHKKASS